MKGLEEFEAWPVVASESQGILKSGEEEGGGVPLSGAWGMIN